MPAIVCCTSGTAAANFHPAVLEAHHARVPLLVCTADRPPELRDCGCRPDNRPSEPVRRRGALVPRSRSAGATPRPARSGGRWRAGPLRTVTGSPAGSGPSESAVPRAARSHRRSARSRARPARRRTVDSRPRACRGTPATVDALADLVRAHPRGRRRRGLGLGCRRRDHRPLRGGRGLAGARRSRLGLPNGAVCGVDLRSDVARRDVRRRAHARHRGARRRAAHEQGCEPVARGSPAGHRRPRSTFGSTPTGRRSTVSSPTPTRRSSRSTTRSSTRPTERRGSGSGSRQNASYAAAIDRVLDDDARGRRNDRTRRGGGAPAGWHALRRGVEPAGARARVVHGAAQRAAHTREPRRERDRRFRFDRGRYRSCIARSAPTVALCGDLCFLHDTNGLLGARNTGRVDHVCRHRQRRRRRSSRISRNTASPSSRRCSARRTASTWSRSPGRTAWRPNGSTRQARDSGRTSSPRPPGRCRSGRPGDERRPAPALLGRRRDRPRLTPPSIRGLASDQGRDRRTVPAGLRERWTDFARAEPRGRRARVRLARLSRPRRSPRCCSLVKSLTPTERAVARLSAIGRWMLARSRSAGPAAVCRSVRSSPPSSSRCCSRSRHRRISRGRVLVHDVRAHCHRAPSQSVQHLPDALRGRPHASARERGVATHARHLRPRVHRRHGRGSHR